MFLIISVSLSVGNIAENEWIDFIRLSEGIFQVTTRIQDYFSVCSIDRDLLMLALSRKDMKGCSDFVQDNLGMVQAIGGNNGGE